jgi:hypothetical protein
MLENENFDFIFCFNDVNMLKGIWGFAPTEILEKSIIWDELKLWKIKWNLYFTMP